MTHSSMKQSRTALITGASSGIGRDLAELFARDQANLVLVARRIELLDDLAHSLEQRHGIRVVTIQSDLARPDAAAGIAARLEAEQIVIQDLVNNAGYGRLAPFVENDLTDDLEMIQVNVIALTALTKLMVGSMVSRGEGRILNVASTAAFQPGPLMAVYYASKAYVLSFSEALSNELKGTGVTVTALCPGPTRTGFQEEAGLNTKKDRAPMMESARVAWAGYQGMMEGKTLVIPGLSNKLLVQGTRFIPRRLSAAVIRFIQESRRA
ncbi:MAG: SDR family oxidoreductase [Gemmatimonadota bacterium]